MKETDKQKLLKLLEEFGLSPDDTTTLGAAFDELVVGCEGFVVNFTFKGDKFDSVGIWE